MSGISRPGRRAQCVFAFCLLCVSVAMLVEAWRIEGWPDWASAGAFPLALALVMLACLLWDSRRLLRQSPAGGAFRQYVSRDWAGFVSLAVAFVALLAWCGFFVASTLFLWSAMLFLHRGRPWFALCVAVGISAVIYALFTVVFKVGLP